MSRIEIVLPGLSRDDLYRMRQLSMYFRSAEEWRTMILEHISGEVRTSAPPFPTCCWTCQATIVHTADGRALDAIWCEVSRHTHRFGLNLPFASHSADLVIFCVNCRFLRRRSMVLQFSSIPTRPSASTWLHGGCGTASVACLR